MAEIVAPGVVEIVKKLCSLAEEEIGLVSGVQEEVKKLQHTFGIIQSELMDAEMQQANDEPTKLWLKRVKDVAYEADDVLDEFKYEALQRKHGPLKSKTKGVVDEHPKNEVHRETHAFVDDSDVFGREGDKVAIVDMLIRSSSQEILCVIPIVGMGGLGKTTLAQLVYKDASVVAHFGKTMWICVSDDFDVIRIAREMLEIVIGSKCDISNMTEIGSKIQENLSGTRFLLVLDDVWNENREKWDKLKPLLSIGAQGSKIFVTTRKDKVAEIMGTVLPHRLTGLAENEGWSIFERRAFGNGGAEKTPNLEEIGKGLVAKCGGVPLAIKSLGGLMHSKKNEIEWLSMLKSEIWDSREVGNENFPILKLSYDNLASPMKQCFVYCSIFPKDYEINKDMLIQLWMAQGLLQPSSEGKLMEDVGNEYFNSLVWNSFFQDVEKDWKGDIEKCKMHDLVHDLARSIAGSEVSEYGDKVKGNLETRHLSVIVSEETILEALYTLKELRTFLTFGCKYLLMHNHPLKMSNFKRLRALDLSGSEMEKLPSSIGKLIHLRYLDLSDNPIKMLPKSITKLYNLETLRLSECLKLESLPVDMRRMINLRHVEIEFDEDTIWSGMPNGVGQLSKLQTLPVFVVSNDNRSCSGIGELGCLTQLGGTLLLHHLENVKNRKDASDANLRAKSNLCGLGLTWSNGSSNVKNQDDVLDELQPPPNLKGLVIRGFAGTKLPTWMHGGLHSQQLQVVDSNISSFATDIFLERLLIVECHNILSMEHNFSGLTSLQKLYIHKCRNLVSLGGKGLIALEKLSIKECPKLTSLSDDGGLQDLIKLKKLVIKECPKLEFLPNGIQYFKALGTLKLDKCSNLKALPQGLGNLSTLQILTIMCCPNLTSLPEEMQHLGALQKLQIEKCHALMDLPEGLGNLTALQELIIKGSPNLKSLPKEMQLGALQELQIEECHGLIDLPESLGNLTALQKLTIKGSPNLKSLPKEIQHHRALKELWIGECDGLMDFPEGLGNLTSLVKNFKLPQSKISTSRDPKPHISTRFGH